ncbi:sporulation protein [Jeotgalibacillus soli]|uniref:Sporulation protein n=1 Tax=Jeotgalibacillus soli TaxID=889306 RepID=A0A0C2SD42_9BACL|nr:sporulation protein [Jeotgalibacillus soli]KIL51884.1 hypothetical protein KP78_02540 [Jeotgalibacillus soli]
MLSMWNNLFSKRSKHVDLILDSHEFTPGEKVTGSFRLTCGRSKQKLKRLECDLVVKDTNTNEERVIETAATILMSKTLKPDEEAVIPFSYVLPIELASTSQNITYRFHTRLIFNENVNRTDHDDIKIIQNKT